MKKRKQDDTKNGNKRYLPSFYSLPFYDNYPKNLSKE